MFGKLFGRQQRAIMYQGVEQHYEDSESNSERESHEYFEPKVAHEHRPSKTSSTTIVLALVMLGYLAGWFTRETVGKYYFHAIPDMHRPQSAVVPQSITQLSIEKVFRNNHTFDVDRVDEESNKAWDAYFSRFISLDKDVAKNAGLGPTVSAHGRPVYSVAAYHQLHCVHVVRYAWNQLKVHGPDILEEPYPGLEALTEGYTIEGHTSHCLDMIRQALECHADPTLEPMMSEDGETVSSDNLASGWGGTAHVCRDFSALTKWVDAPEQHPLLSVEAFVNGDGAMAHGHHDHGSHGSHGSHDSHDSHKAHSHGSEDHVPEASAHDMSEHMHHP